MTTAMQIGETARDRADFCRCFKTGAAVFLHDDGIVAHLQAFRNTNAMAMHDRPVANPVLLRLSVTARPGNMNDARGHVGDNRPKSRGREAFLMPLDTDHESPARAIP